MNTKSLAFGSISFLFPLFASFSPFAFSPLSYMILLSPLGFSLNFSTIYLQYSSFSPSSITSIMNLGLWSVWGSKLLLTVASPTGCSHGAPNASLEYWINPTTTSVLSNQHRHYFLLLCTGAWCSGGWMGFESVVLWVKVEIISTGRLSIWGCFMQFHFDYKAFPLSYRKYL